MYLVHIFTVCSSKPRGKSTLILLAPDFPNENSLGIFLGFCLVLKDFPNFKGFIFPNLKGFFQMINYVLGILMNWRIFFKGFSIFQGLLLTGARFFSFIRPPVKTFINLRALFLKSVTSVILKNTSGLKLWQWLFVSHN